jgi:hypothetical protein
MLLFSLGPFQFLGVERLKKLEVENSYTRRILIKQQQPNQQSSFSHNTSLTAHNLLLPTHIYFHFFNFDTMADERDEARLKMRAEANFERNLRYKDSRLRTIGLPTQALAQQVAERKFAKQREIDEGKAERARNAEIDAMLEKVATDEEELRRQRAMQMRAEWNAQIQEKELMRKQGRQDEINSFQNDTPMEFAGDDPLHAERVAQQRDQVRRWTEEDVADRAWRRQQEHNEDMAQAQLNLTIDEMRMRQQEEEDRLKKEVTRKILSENNDVSAVAAAAVPFPLNYETTYFVAYHII